MSDSDEPDWVVEQASADKRTARAPSSSGESPSLAGDDEPPEAADDASDLWSSDDKPVQEEEDDDDDEEEEEASQPVASQASPGAKPKPKSSKAPPASRLPFVLPPKVRRDLLLLESTDSTLDLSGDSGTIGRLRVHSQSSSATTTPPPHGEHALTIDLKGKVFDGDVVPCNTLCIVSIDGKQAKVEAVCSDFVRLGAPRGSIFDMETVQEGDFGDDFFDDDSQGGHSHDDDDELGPLKEGKAKSGGKAKAKAGSKAKPKPKGKAGGGSGSKPKRPAPAAKGAASAKKVKL